MPRTHDDYPYAAIRELFAFVREEILPQELAPLYQQVADLREEVAVLRRERHQSFPSPQMMDCVARAIEEAERGVWEPWRWAEEFGVQESTIITLLSKRRAELVS